jgi:uncharacterized membrane protein YfhO
MARTNIPARLVDGQFNPRTMVFLPEELRAALPAIGRSEVTVRDVHFTAHRITFSVTSAAPALVVVAQSYYPNWHARVSGQTVPLWPANYAFQAVAVPAGQHEVMLEYRDQRFYLGLGISMGSLLLAAGLWWRWRTVKTI